MDLGREIIAQQLFFRKELRERAYWFIGLRWLAVAAGLLGLVAAGHWDLGLPWPWLLAVLAFVAAYNLGCWLWGRRLEARAAGEVRPFHLFINAQMVLDLAALALLVLCTGGPASPLAFFFVLHVVLAGILLSPLVCFAYALLAIAYLGLINAWRLGLGGLAWPAGLGGAWFSRAAPPGEAWAAYLAFALGLLVAAFLTSSIKVALRFKGRQLMKVSKELEDSNLKLASLYEMMKELGGSLSRQQMLDVATKNAARIMGVKACSIKLLDPEGQSLRFASTYGLSQNYLAKEGISVAKSPVNRQILEHKRYSIGHIDQTQAFQYPEDVRQEGITSMLCLPLQAGPQVLGVFCVYSGQSHFFSEADADFFALMSDLTALALDKQGREEAKTWFLNKAAHQLRSPLAAVSSMLQVLGGGYQGALAPAQQETVQRCQRRLEVLRQTINDLLSLAAGRQLAASWRLGGVDLAPILDALVPLYKVLADHQGLELAFDLAAGLPPVLGEARLLDDVFNNLLSNAVKYTPPGGRVEVRLALAEPGWLKVEVSDTGIGIAPADQARLFGEFFRAETAKAMCEEGTGLGLVIVKQIIDSLGGRVEVASQEGRGTRVTCRLPVVPEARQA